MDNNTGEMVVNILLTVFTISVYYGLALMLSCGDTKIAIVCGMIGLIRAGNTIDTTELQKEISKLKQKLNEK